MKKIILAIGLFGMMFLMTACDNRTVTLDYVSNGGSEVSSMDVVQLMKLDEPETTRNGYSFVGWFNEINFQSEFDFDAGASRNLTLYAKWSIETTTIAFYPDNDEDIASITNDYQEVITFPDNPIKEGYTFSGWYTDEAFTEAFELLTMPAQDTNLYAKWDPIIFVIDFMIDAEIVSVRSVQYGQTLIDIPNVPVVIGYVGVWSSVDFENIKDNSTVEAVYEKELYQVTFKDIDGNIFGTFDIEYEGTVAPLSPTPVKEESTFYGYSHQLDTFLVTEDVEITIYFTPMSYMVTFRGFQGIVIDSTLVQYGLEAVAPVVVAPVGYTFVSWDQSFDEITEDTFVNAVFEPISYSLELNGNNGLFSTESSTLTITKNYLEKTGIPENPVRPGYTFAGWYHSLADDAVQETFTDLTVMQLGGMELYAKWSLNNYVITYENTFNTPHGNVLNYNIETENMSLTDPTTRQGYTFDGWFTTLSNGMQVTEITQGTIGDQTLYAQWSVVEYNMTYSNLEGETHSNQATYNIESQAITLSDPSVREGYTFGGWYTSLSGGDQVTTVAQGTTDDINVYAHWTEIDYTITYENTYDLSHTNPVEYTIGDETITLTTPLQRTHYIFSGWYTALVGGDQVTTIAQGTTGDKILYARWTAQNYTISFDIDGTITELQVPYLGTITSGNVPSIPTKEYYDNTPPQWDENPVGYQVIGTHTFGAVYIPNEYTITFDTNGGESIDTVTMSYGDIFSMPSTPTKQGYSFVAWYQDLALIELYDFNDPVENHITLTATWDRDYYEIDVTSNFEKVDLDDSQIIDVDGSSISWNIINILYGEEISFIQNYEGYVFDRYVIDNVTYYANQNLEIDETMLTAISTTGIEVYYRRIILNVTFLQDEDLFAIDADATTEISVHYGEDLNTGVPVLIEKSGFFVTWNQNTYENIREDVIVYAMYLDTTIKTISFMDQGITRYIATQNAGDTIAIADNSILWNLTRDGYVFEGWFTSQNGGTQVVQADLYYSNALFTVNQNTLYAQWTELPSYAQPVITDVLVAVAGDQFTMSWTMDPATLEGTSPENFIITLNNIEIMIPSNLVTLDGNTYTVVVNNTTTNTQLYNDFEILNNAGSHQITIKPLGENGVQNDGETSEIYNYSRDSIYEGNPENIAIYDYFIIESFENANRYVFYTDLNYQFSDLYEFEIISGNEFATANGNVINTTDLNGSFRFRMIRAGEETQVFDAIVVRDIKQFEHGSNYNTYLDAQTQYLQTENISPYYVGINNEYHLDLRIVNNQGARVELSETLLQYELYLKTGEVEVLIPTEELATHIEYLPNNQLQMLPESLGNTYLLKVKPRYQSTQMQVNGNDYVEYEFTVNDGYNAFSNNQLKSLYSNMDVSTINIHANIVAELSEAQMNADGSPKNIRANSTIENTGNVYTRFDTQTDNDNFTIEGNYMSIDGSQLPSSNSSSGSGLVGFSQSFDIINVQIGIFNYDVTDSDDEYDNNIYNMNNLTIIGNTVTPNINYSGTPGDILLQERLMSKNSGGYLGIFAHSASVNLNNMRIGYTLIALTGNASGKTDNEVPLIATLNYVKIYESWANSLYSHGGGGFELANCSLEQSGGAAIHAVDTTVGSEGNNPTINIHQSTEINNWVSGDEAWFKAYGMAPVALQLKSSIESAIAPTQRSIISNIDNPVTGLATQMFNLVMLTEPSNSAITYSDEAETIQNAGSEVNFILEDGYGTTELTRSWDYLNTPDPRIAGGQYGFPVGMYSEAGAFLGLVGELMTTYGQDQGTAISLATIAGFYNLTASEVITVYTYVAMNGVSFDNSIANVLPSHIGKAPQYLEVLASVPLFESGYSTVLIELEE